MFKNHLKVAYRNLTTTKGYSTINIGGLAIGMAIAILIGLWIYDELSFNKYHKNYNQIGQVIMTGRFNGKGYFSTSMPRPLEGELRNKYGSHFKHIVMSRWSEDHILSVGDKKITQIGRFMQAGAPEMLSLKMKRGTWAGLTDPSSILLSETAAKALFGDTDPTDKMMRIDNQMDVKVTGVYEDLPYNSDFGDIKFLSTWDLLMANNKWMQDAADNWGNTSFLIYAQVAPNTTIDAVTNRIAKAMHDNVDEEEKKFNIRLKVQPMSRWHLYSDWKDGVNVGGRIQFVWLFGIIGVFVLLLACINFMNLSTARSERRAKEVGIRKAIGSMRSQLIAQFLSESFLVVCIAFLIAVGLVAVSLPLFNELADKRMAMPWIQPLFWSACVLFIVCTSLIAGSYPAFYLSSFKPIRVLKGAFRPGRSASLPRKVLVVVQFSVSVALIIGTIIVYKQVQHAKNRPVGYDRSGLLMVQIKSQELKEKFGVLQDALKREGIAEYMACTSSPLTGVWSNNGGFEWRGKDETKVDGFGTIWITHDYGKTVGWQFMEGRDFSSRFATDSVSSTSKVGPVYSIVVNEAAANYMGFQNAVGEIVRWSDHSFKIIGVIRDMVMESPFDPVRHMVYLVSYENADSWITLRINPDISASAALSKMESLFKQLVPSIPFDYKFVDNEYEQKFAAEERIGKLAFVFAALAIFISCLGLFGLASFMAEKRTKEIGIRKVLGATVYNIWGMLSRDFVLLVAIACAIAIPLAFHLLKRWLQNYEYRTEMSWWVFVVAISGALMITLITVSFQAIRTASGNPVKSLRSE